MKRRGSGLGRRFKGQAFRRVGLAKSQWLMGFEAAFFLALSRIRPCLIAISTLLVRAYR